jgi:hypothetical protein
VTRFAIAGMANALVEQSSRLGGPMLNEHSSRETLCRWLQWCDPNGCHTDELAAAEDFAPTRWTMRGMQSRRCWPMSDNRQGGG